MAVSYLVFGYADCYPSGGMNDCIMKTNERYEVVQAVEDWVLGKYYKHYDYFEVFSTLEGNLIYEAEKEVDYDNEKGFIILREVIKTPYIPAHHLREKE